MSSGPVLGESFSRENRLRKRREFEECYASGVRASGRHLQFFALQRRGEPGPARLGISIPRRAGKAVLRNRLRRRLREIFRKNRGALPAGPIDLVIQCRPSAVRVSPSVLLADYLDTAARTRERGSRRK